MPPTSDLHLARAYYAEELRAVANIQSEALVKAFAKVRREHFLGPGPWQISNPNHDSYRTTPDPDPRHLYHNVLVAIDATRYLNNGQPSLLAYLIDALELRERDRAVHIGCGTGYYTAIIGEVVGPMGRITAIEIDPELAQQARSNLSYLPQIEVLQGDGGSYNPGPSDAILINAGVTHPQSFWLDSLRPGGRLLLPLTAADDEGGTAGGVLKIKRQHAGFAASFITRVGIFPCQGSRDAKLNQRLKKAFDLGDWKSVRSFRRDSHEPADTCWLHADNFCLSKLAVPE